MPLARFAHFTMAATPNKSPEQEDDASDEASVLEGLLHRRHNAAHKERRARDAYAFGVDVRRTRWFIQHRLLGAGLRGVERQWKSVWEMLQRDTLDHEATCPAPLLRELANCVKILGAPTPTVSCLNERAHLSGAWPSVTALGTSHGDVRHLLLDLRGIQALSDTERRFALASALGHLQCDHALFFTAALVARLEESGVLYRGLQRALRPTTKLMCFSADRAALLCGDGLESTMEGLRQQVAETRSVNTRWLPQPSSYDLRVTAIREFFRSDVHARILSARIVKMNSDRSSTDGDASAPQPHVPDDAWSVAKVDRRLTQRLGLL